MRQWPITLCLAVAGLGLAVIWFADFKIGLLIVGLALLLGAALRAALPEVGMLAVRSRFTDVGVLTFLGGVIVLLTLVAQPDPWLHLSWLDDIGRLVGAPALTRRGRGAVAGRAAPRPAPTAWRALCDATATPGEAAYACLCDNLTQVSRRREIILGSSAPTTCLGHLAICWRR
ncbi:DUF3017 domain-containing protein [Kitasatospora arboriphila]